MLMSGISSLLSSSFKLLLRSNGHQASEGHRTSLGLTPIASLLFVALSIASPIPSHGQCGTTWKGPASGGLWNVAGNWSAGVPTSSTNTCIDNGNPQNSAVTLNIGGAQAANLTIDSNDSLSFNDNTNLTINGTTISNAGKISLNSSGDNTDLILAGNDSVTLSGGGTLTLSNFTTNRIYSAGGSGSLTNQQTIQGAGQIGVGLTFLANSGTINANVSNTLSVVPNSSGVTNTGTLEATTGGTLDLQGNYANTGGTINASGTSSVVELDGATINSGTLTTSSSGTIKTINSTTLNGVTLNTGTNYVNPDNTTTTLKGTITNNGTIALNSGGDNTNLVISGPVTLTGTGTVNLGNSFTNRIYSGSGSDTLTIKQVIQGAGQLGVGLTTLVNQSTVDSNFSGSTLQISPNSGGVNNTSATLEATNGATLQLLGTYTNTSGTIKALNATAASTVLLDGATINGGTLTSTGNGTIQTQGSAALNGVTLSTGTSYVIPDNTTTTLQGTITNNGTIAMNSGGDNTNLVISGPVTLTGTGTLNLGNSFTNRIYSGSGSDTLTIKQVIQGAGQLGVGLTTLVNQSTVDSNFSGSTLQINPNGGGVTNTSAILEATSGATLQLLGTYTNTSGTIQAVNATAASTVLLDGATINGGTLTSTGNGTIQTQGSAALNGVTLSTGTSYVIPDNTNTTLQGTITNNGTISQNSGGDNTNLLISGPVTLTGTGTLTLSDNAANRIYAPNGADTFTIKQVIQGAGQLGVGLTKILNSSIIDADYSGGTLTVAPNGSGLTNAAGTLESTNGGVLNLVGLFTNAGGKIEALTGSTTQIIGANVKGGTLTTVGTGVIDVYNGSTLNGLTISAGSNVTLLDNSSTILVGTITDNGTLNLSSGGDNTEVQLSGNVTLAGTGKLIMTNNGANRVYAPSGTNALINGITIQGAGQIGLAFTGIVNNGTINANGSAGIALDTNSTGLTNNGTLQTGAGDTMHVFGGPFSNFAGTTLTGGSYVSAGTLEIDEIGSTGGEIVTDAANITLNGGTFVDSGGHNVLNNLATITSAGSFTVMGGSNFTTAGNFTNNGILTVGTGTSFVVNGKLTNFAGTTLTGGTYNVAGTLQFNGANIVTDAANIILTGAAAKIVNQTSVNALTNLATINSGASFGLSGGANFTTAGNFTNNGTLSPGTGTKFVVNGNLTNFSGTKLTGGTYNVGGTLQFNGANIVTDAANITLTGAAAKIVNQTSVNALTNLATINSGASFGLSGGANFTTAGNFTNNGTLSPGTGTKFVVNGNLTNFSSTTLTGGTYVVGGALQFNGANIVNNAANITLNGTASKIVDQTQANGLANFANNNASGSFTLAGGKTFTTAGSFSNAGTVLVSKGTTLTMGGTSSYMQTGGQTTVDGKMVATAPGAFNINGGSVFGNGGNLAGKRRLRRYI